MAIEDTKNAGDEGTIDLAKLLSHPIIDRYRLKPLLLVAGMLLFSAVIGSMFLQTSLMALLALVGAIFLYMLVPGYFLLLNVELDDIERVVLSMAVGISLIPLLLFNLNLFWVRVNAASTIVVIVLVTLAGIVLKEKEWLKSRLKKNKSG